MDSEIDDKYINAYKVVTNTRKSLLPLFLFDYALRYLKRNNPLKEKLEQSGLINTYRKGHTIVAKNWAQPICCFKTFTSALNWVKVYFPPSDYKIIKVRGYDRIHTDDVRMLYFNYDRWQLYLISKDSSGLIFPCTITDAIFFRKIQVLT